MCKAAHPWRLLFEEKSFQFSNWLYLTTSCQHIKEANRGPRKDCLSMFIPFYPYYFIGGLPVLFYSGGTYLPKHLIHGKSPPAGTMPSKSYPRDQREPQWLILDHIFHPGAKLLGPSWLLFGGIMDYQKMTSLLGNLGPDFNWAIRSQPEDLF